MKGNTRIFNDVWESKINDESTGAILLAVLAHKLDSACEACLASKCPANGKDLLGVVIRTVDCRSVGNGFSMGDELCHLIENAWGLCFIPY